MKRSEPTRRANARRLFAGAAALLLSLALLFSLLSCGKTVEPADEAEAIAAAERLVGEAETWIRLFYTKDGMPLLENGREKGVYREVDGAEMEKLGLARLSDLKKYERTIFSPSMCAAQDAVLFSGGADWNAALIENTEFDFSSGTGKEVFICLLACPDELPRLPGDEAIYDFSAAQVTDNRGDRVKVRVPARGTGKNESKTAFKTFDLIKLDGAWYLDNYPNVRFAADPEPTQTKTATGPTAATGP